jgi:LPXTG-motif cell wall-anchored protein
VSVQQSSSGGGTGDEVYVLSIMAGVAMVAGAAIFVVRKKKQQLDDLNVKTPTRDRMMTAAGALQLLATPKENINVL